MGFIAVSGTPELQLKCPVLTKHYQLDIIAHICNPGILILAHRKLKQDFEFKAKECFITKQSEKRKFFYTETTCLKKGNKKGVLPAGIYVCVCPACWCPGGQEGVSSPELELDSCEPRVCQGLTLGPWEGQPSYQLTCVTSLTCVFIK